MTVATFKQPNYHDQVGNATEYPDAIDSAVKVLAEYAAGFAVHERDPADLRVTMDAGKVADDTTNIPILIAAQDSVALVAPTGNPRHDIVYLDENNIIGVAQGAEAGAPADPQLPTGATAKARIVWTIGAAQITNDMLEDLRIAAGGGSGGWTPISGEDFDAGASIDFTFVDDETLDQRLILTNVLSDTRGDHFGIQLKPLGGAFGDLVNWYTLNRIYDTTQSAVQSTGAATLGLYWTDLAYSATGHPAPGIGGTLHLTRPRRPNTMKRGQLLLSAEAHNPRRTQSYAGAWGMNLVDEVEAIRLLWLNNAAASGRIEHQIMVNPPI